MRINTYQTLHTVGIKVVSEDVKKRWITRAVELV